MYKDWDNIRLVTIVVCGGVDLISDATPENITASDNYMAGPIPCPTVNASWDRRVSSQVKSIQFIAINKQTIDYTIIHKNK